MEVIVAYRKKNVDRKPQKTLDIKKNYGYTKVCLEFTVQICMLFTCKL